MKFQQYINETEDYGYLSHIKGYGEEVGNKIWEAIEKDCKPFLKEARKGGDFLWRGAEIGNDTIEKGTVRKDRRSRFIYKTLHEWLDKSLKELFGWKPRSEGLFTGSHYITSRFGQPRMVFPIGKFNYIVLDSKNIKLIYRYYDEFGYVHELKEKAIKKAIYDIIKKYKTKGLSKYLKENEYECIVNCKNYYSVHNKWYDFLIGKL